MAIARKTAVASSPNRSAAARGATRKTAAKKTTASKPDAARPAPKATAKPAKAAKPAKVEKVDKARKPKLVRDSFTIPKNEYAVLDLLKERAARAGRPTKKSELLRAGIQALAGMADPAFLGAVSAVPSLKTGRPPKA